MNRAVALSVPSVSRHLAHDTGEFRIGCGRSVQLLNPGEATSAVRRRGRGLWGLEMMGFTFFCLVRLHSVLLHLCSICARRRCKKMAFNAHGGAWLG